MPLNALDFGLKVISKDSEHQYFTVAFSIKFFRLVKGLVLICF